MTKKLNHLILGLLALCIICVLPISANAADTKSFPSSYSKEDYEANGITSMDVDKDYTIDLKADQDVCYSFKPKESAYYTLVSDGNYKVEYRIYTYNSSTQTYKSTTDYFYYFGGQVHHVLYLSSTKTYHFRLAYEDITKAGKLKFTVKSNRKVVSYDGYSASYANTDCMSDASINVNVTYEDGKKGVIAANLYNLAGSDDDHNSVYLYLEGDEQTETDFENAKPGTYKFKLNIVNSSLDSIFESDKTEYVSITILSGKDYVNKIPSITIGKAVDIKTTMKGTIPIKFVPSATGLYGFTFKEKVPSNDGFSTQIYYRRYDKATTTYAYDNYTTRYQYPKNETVTYNLKAGETYVFYISSISDGSMTINRLNGTIPVTSVAMQSAATVAYGETYDLYSSLSYAPANATNTTIAWSSSNTSVATVNKGIVSAKGCGTAVITATIGDKTAKCTITVPVPKKGSKFVVSKATYKITKAGATGGTVSFVKTASKKASLSIPKTVKYQGITYKVTAIADKACAGKTKLTKVTIGANVSKIGKNAFKGCKKLKSLNIKTTKLTLKKVGKNAFAGVPKNVKITTSKKKAALYKQIIRKKGAK